MQTPHFLKQGATILAVAVATVGGATILRRPPAVAAEGRNPASLNAAAPELVGAAWLNTPNGKPMKLAERKGKVTILHFWTFACSNCKANLPAYARWHQKLAAKDVILIGIHTPELDIERDPKNVANFAKNNGIAYPILLDARHENWNRWRQQYWPTVYLIDKQGRVRYAWVGELNYNNAGGEAKMERLVAQLLNEKPINEKPMTARQGTPMVPAATDQATTGKVTKTEAEWKRDLTPQQFKVLRQKGTEAPGTGALLHNHEKGIYRCAGCDQALFSSATKFESGTGWPSFYAPLAGGVRKHEDQDGSGRVEVLCSRCDGHLGHVFDDGPAPTGLRYCMNSVALKFSQQP